MFAFLRPVALAAAVVLVGQVATAADKRPMTIRDLFRFQRVAAPRISPDGKMVIYQVGTVDLEKNKTSTALWLAATDGKAPPRQFTDPDGKKDSNPRWSPDGKQILFESTRSGTSQLWVIRIDGGEAKQLTDISTGASNGIWSPDGAHIAFTSAVYPEFSEKPFEESNRLNKEKDEAIEKSPVKARVFKKLFYRHWDEYVEDKRQHLFVLRVGYAKHESPQSPDELRKATPRDVTPGDRDAYPTSTTFSSGDDFTFTPDGRHLVFTAVPEKNEAWSTNYDICRVSITNTSPKWECLTKDNKAADSGPKFSQNGKALSWRAQKKAGYEADRWDIMVAACGPDGALVEKPKNVTEVSGLSVNEFTWSPLGSWLFSADSAGEQKLYAISGPAMVALDSQSGSVSGITAAGSRVVFLRPTMSAPADVFTLPLNGVPELTNLSHANDALLAQLDRPRPEAVEVPVEGGVKMQMWILKPPGFDPEKKWPVAFLVHGGPQGAWEDGWSYRWNPSLWAAQGYVVVLPNPRGSTGFGQKFVDEITGDWGGKCYRDLVAGLEYVKKLPYVDSDRLATAGASFGGYMQNWFAVNEIAKNFKCQINHDGVWNFESMWGTTDELWFDEWEHGGLPWEKPGKYREFSPHVKAGNLARYKVPMLIIHNDLDFRCPIGQGHELFSALQRQGVPSKLINFPDEGHWVLKPRNSQYWHKEVFAWLKKYAPPGGR